MASSSSGMLKLVVKRSALQCVTPHMRELSLQKKALEAAYSEDIKLPLLSKRQTACDFFSRYV